jgi:hypothetical protein
VPACPEWTVFDLVEHVAGHCLRRIGETSDGAAANGAGLEALLRAWGHAAAAVEPRIADGTEDVELLLMDTFTHELDLRAALGAPPPAADHPAYPWAFDVVVGGLSWSLGLRQLPALRLVCADGPDYVAGVGRPAITVRASRYDMYRTLTGRRCARRIRDLSWSEDPSRWLEAFFWGPFSEPGLAVD